MTILTVASVSLSAQLRNNTTPSNGSINLTTAFLDASSSATWNGSTNNGKGLVFPRTDLVAMTSLAAPVNGIATSYPTRLDGMIVYNTATGTAATGTAGVSVVPGFYYYDNKSSSLNGGTWKPFLSTSKVNYIDNTEVVTNEIFNNAPVYAYKGSFVADGTTTAVSIPSPTGMTGMTGITIYKAGTTTAFARELYSYTLGTGPGNAITGSTNISVVYPAGTYNYILEYIK